MLAIIYLRQHKCILLMVNAGTGILHFSHDKLWQQECTMSWLLLFFVALRPKSRAMVMTGRSVHLATLFPGQA